MAVIIGVRFKRTGKIYYFDPCQFNIQIGDEVIVETARGMEFGEVTIEPREVTEDEVVSPLKPVLRIATEQDRAQVRHNEAMEKEAMRISEERIAHHGLDMKLVDVEYTFDAKKVIIYFTSDGRVDFRELVRDLASLLHMRIELRQIGVRDETKMMGGLGPCGRIVCCNAFLDDFHPVSIRMAKDQNISLNPTKISGLCGRLMCCLEFEHEFYRQSKGRSPKIGGYVITPDGPGEVVDASLIREVANIRVMLPDQTLEQRTYGFDSVQSASKEEYDDAVQHPERFIRNDESKGAEGEHIQPRRSGGYQSDHDRNRPQGPRNGSQGGNGQAQSSNGGAPQAPPATEPAEPGADKGQPKHLMPKGKPQRPPMSKPGNGQTQAAPKQGEQGRQGEGNRPRHSGRHHGGARQDQAKTQPPNGQPPANKPNPS